MPHQRRKRWRQQRGRQSLEGDSSFFSFAAVGCGFESGFEAWVWMGCGLWQQLRFCYRGLWVWIWVGGLGLNGLWVFSGVCIGFEWVMDLRLVSEFRWCYFGGCIGFESVTETWVWIDLWFGWLVWWFNGGGGWLVCCHRRERQRGRRGRERIVIYIILLCSLYYFIGLYVKIKKGDVKCIVKWVDKIDKIAF